MQPVVMACSSVQASASRMRCSLAGRPNLASWQVRTRQIFNVWCCNARQWPPLLRLIACVCPAAIIGEKITGKGPLGQVGLETGIPLGQQSIFILVRAISLAGFSSLSLTMQLSHNGMSTLLLCITQCVNVHCRPSSGFSCLLQSWKAMLESQKTPAHTETGDILSSRMSRM